MTGTVRPKPDRGVQHPGLSAMLEVMETTAFDSLEAARKLEAAGIERKQAEVQAEVIAQALQGGGLVTKTDLAQLETRLTNRLYLALGILFAALVAVRFFA